MPQNKENQPMGFDIKTPIALKKTMPVLGGMFQVLCGEAWGSERSATDEDPALSFELGYTAELWKPVHGAADGAVRYLDNADLIVNMDLESLFGIPSVKAYSHGLYNNGEALTGDAIGDALGISNIEVSVTAFRLLESWLEYNPDNLPFSLRAGLYDLNSEFDALDTSAFFIGSAHGIGPDISQSGENGPSIFPVTSLAARLDLNLGEGFTFRTAILDGVSGDPDNPQRTAILLGKSDGALSVSELEWQQAGAKLLAGYWRYTSESDRLLSEGSENNSGGYLRGESLLFENEGDINRSVSAFFRAGWANGDVNQFSDFYAGGVVMNGIFSKRGDDQLGLAVASAGISDQFALLEGVTFQRETVFELSYRTPILGNFVMQPNIQYVINPAGDGPVSNDALVIGLRMELGWTHDIIH